MKFKCSHHILWSKAIASTIFCFRIWVKDFFRGDSPSRVTTVAALGSNRYIVMSPSCVGFPRNGARNGGRKFQNLDLNDHEFSRSAKLARSRRPRSGPSACPRCSQYSVVDRRPARYRETPLWSVCPCNTGAPGRTPRLPSDSLRCRLGNSARRL